MNVTRIWKHLYAFQKYILPWFLGIVAAKLDQFVKFWPAFCFIYKKSKVLKTKNLIVIEKFVMLTK